MDPRFRGDDGTGNARICRLLQPVILAFALLTATLPALAQVGTDVAPLQFRDRAEEVRFHALVAELRCVMCQNQSLADSNAQIAHDLRREVLGLMRSGRSDAEIKDFLVARYGEFVLYRPRVEGKTWLLWAGPLLLLAIGGVVVAHVVRRHGSGAKTAPGDRASGNDDQEW